MADDGYVCQLDEASALKAKKELNEEPRDRLNAVDALRTWIQQQPHLTFCTDTLALLNFLRTAKFSQLRARELVENYVKVVTNNPTWFRNIDTHDPALVEVIESGYAFPLPKCDKNGCRILFYRIAAAEKKNGEMISVADELRAASIIGFHSGRDENIQVNGLVFVIDMTDIGTKHMTRWSMDDMKKWSASWQNSMPGRFKAFHYYNVGAIFDTIMAISKPFLSKKVQDRMHVHNTMESLYKSIDMELLPDEYLPDDYNGPSAGTVQEITAKFRDDVMKPDFRQMLLEHTSERTYSVDESKRPAYKPVKESFRKLAVD